MSEPDSLKRAGLVGVLMRLAVAATSVAVIPVIIVSRGSDVYGLYATATSLTALLVFSDLGLGQGLMNRVASRLDGRQELVSTTVGLACGFAAILTVLYWSLITWTGAGRFIASGAISESVAQRTVLLFGISFLLAVPLGLAQRVQQGLQEGVKAHLWAGIGAMSGALSSGLAAYFHAPIPIVCCLPIWVVAVFNGLQFWSVTRQHADCRPQFKSFQWKLVTALLRSSLSFLSLNLAAAAAYHSATLLVAVISGIEQAAVFAVTSKVTGLLFLACSAYMQQLWPAIVLARSQGRSLWAEQQVARHALGAGVVTGLLALISLPFLADLITITFGEEVRPSDFLVAMLLVWNVQQAALLPFALHFNAIEILGFQILTSLLMAICSVLASIYLLPVFPTAGATIALVVCHAVFVAAPSVLRFIVGRGVSDDRLSCRI